MGGEGGGGGEEFHYTRWPATIYEKVRNRECGKQDSSGGILIKNTIFSNHSKFVKK